MIIQQFWRDLRTQKLRTFVTIFGITWGTASVILLLGVGESIHDYSSRAMHGMGEGIIILWPGRTGKAYKGMVKGRGISLREEDAALFKAKIPRMKAVSPEYQRSAYFRTKKTPLNAQISGVYPVWGEMRNVIAQAGGRFINQLDQENHRRVVFIGDRLKTDLYGSAPAVGTFLYIDKIPFLVIGILQEKIQTSSYSGRDAGRAVIPASTFRSMYGHRNVNNMVFTLYDPAESELVKKEVYRVLGKKYTFDPEDSEAIGMWDTSESDKFINSFFLIFRLFLGVVASLTLVVGGIGVANIMNVVVEERTREIGVKMAVGAKPRTILWGFLGEALLLSFIGGVLGFAITGTIFKIVNLSPLVTYMGNPHISVFVGIISLIVLTAIAVIAGYFPARRASRMNPVEALR